MQNWPITHYILITHNIAVINYITITPGHFDPFKWYFNDIKGRSPSNDELSDFSFYIDSQKSAHRKFKK